MQTTAKLSATPKLRQKNYASPDCGAKILDANSEAEHTSAILDPSRDEYFLSICSAKIWFVIELCEAIQAQRVRRLAWIFFLRFNHFLLLICRWALPISSYFHPHRRISAFTLATVIQLVIGL